MTRRIASSGGGGRCGLLVTPKTNSGAAARSRTAPTGAVPNAAVAARRRPTGPGRIPGQGADTTGWRPRRSGGLGAPAAPRPYNRVITPSEDARRNVQGASRRRAAAISRFRRKSSTRTSWWSAASRARRRAIKRRARQSRVRRVRRRRIRRAHAALGAERQPRRPPLDVVRHHGRHGALGVSLSTELELRSCHRRVQRRRVRAGQRRGHRRHAALHDERAGVRGDSRQRRPDAVVHRAHERVPRQRRDRSDANGHAGRRRSSASRPARPARARVRHRASSRTGASCVSRASDAPAPRGRAHRRVLGAAGRLRHERTGRDSRSST